MRSRLRERIASAQSVAQFADLLEVTLAALRDDQVTLSERGSRPVRHVPAESDIWATWREGAARVEDVRVASDADIAGVKPGQIVRRVEGIPILRAMEHMTGEGAPAGALSWALRRLTAGPWSGPFTLEVSEGEVTRQLRIERRPPAATNNGAMTPRSVGEARDIGYLRLRHVPGDASFAADVDAALASLRQSRALILDLRDLNGPIDREVIRGLIGRFVDKDTPWQVRVDRAGARVTDVALPREPRFAKVPLAALVDRWTAGDGESLAAGLAAAGAALVGTRMAGLNGELGEVRLPVSGIVVRFPVERAELPSGAPRDSLRPTVLVDPSAPSGGPGDPILYQALKLLG